MSRLIDTHAHIHSRDYKLNSLEVINRAKAAGVEKIICVGTDEKDSKLAVDFAQDREFCFASVGLHPHDAKLGSDAVEVIRTLAKEKKVVAIGECGLDYYYNHSSKEDQIRALHDQIEVALSFDLPMIFHVREAFDDFWPVFDQYQSLRGVVHSFTASEKVLDEVLSRDLYIGLNGIMTFTKDQSQLVVAKICPLDRILLETDSPFLTPSPKRGSVNECANVRLVGQFLSKLRGMHENEFFLSTTKNAEKLFNI